MPELEFRSVPDDHPGVGRNPVYRDKRRAEQFDGPRSRGFAHQREVMPRDSGLLRRILHVAVERAPDDDALLV